jgi:hypothetical protein
MIGFWDPTRNFNEEWIETAAALGGTGLPAVACLAGVGTLPRRHWRWLGVFASALAAVMALYGIWRHVHSGSAAFTIVLSIGLVVAHANLCLFVPLTDSQRWMRVVTILGGMVTAAAIDLMALAEDTGTDFYFAENLAGAAGIITACGSLALLVLARLNRNLDRLPVLSEISQVTIICPACQRKQTLPIGESRCASCNLKFVIKVEEPRCPKCDYLLYKLQSDRCPECGEPVSVIQPANLNG